MLKVGIGQCSLMYYWTKGREKGGWKIVCQLNGYFMFIHFWCFVSIPFCFHCRSVWWERWRASFHSAHHSRDQQDICPFLLNWQEVENLQDISSLYKGQRSLLAWGEGVVINTLYGHGNTIKSVSQAIVMVYLPYLVVITMTMITMAMITMATITMAAITMVAVYFLSLLSHIATWTVYMLRYWTT